MARERGEWRVEREMERGEWEKEKGKWEKEKGTWEREGRVEGREGKGGEGGRRRGGDNVTQGNLVSGLVSVGGKYNTIVRIL